MISTLVQATVVAAVALIAVRIGRRWSPALRESIVILALLKFLLPGTFVGGGLFALVASWMESPHSLAHAPTAPVSSLATGLVVFQITGMVLVAARLAVSCLTCRRTLRTATNVLDGSIHARAAQVAARLGMRRLPSVWVSANTAAPLAFGVFSRHVVVPIALLHDESKLDVVLAHELAHHRRGDLWKFALHRVVVTVWWWHPLAWALAAPLREAVEDGCDDMVLARGVAAEDRYADVLLACARTVTPPPTIVALGFGNRRHPVARRLVRLASDRAQASWRTWVVAAGCGAIVLPGVPSRAQKQPAVVTRIVDAQQIVPVPSMVEASRPARKRMSRENIRALTATALSGLETVRTPDTVREAIAGVVKTDVAAETLGPEPLTALIESRRLDVMSLVLREIDDTRRRVVKRIVHRIEGRRDHNSSNASPPLSPFSPSASNRKK